MVNASERILVIGAGGQVGTELVSELRKMHGADQVVASDIREINSNGLEGPFVILNALDQEAVKKTVLEYKVSTVYLMAAMLSATGEQHPDKAWELNMQSLFHVLDLAKDGLIKRIFWPSSIAVFGPTSPKFNTPQSCVMEPTTVYGISKLAGEHWCDYYHSKYGVDVRSIRYPGLIGSKSAPGGGTTDYAVHIFHEALSTGTYSCFLSQDRALPMMHMEDAVKATIQLMEADPATLSIRRSYNLSGLSFSPKQLASELKKHLPDFRIKYKPDFRDQLAASWPESIDDSVAQEDWDWNSSFDLARLTSHMLDELKIKDLS
jgi:nucleoside-diphosphate-sugar epimerase